MSPTELVLSRLPNAKRNGSGWRARCPAHDDCKPSLSIRAGDDGRALPSCSSTEPKALSLTLVPPCRSRLTCSPNTVNKMPGDGTPGEYERN